MFIDTHAHMNMPVFAGRVAELIGRARLVGIEKIINVGFDLESSKRSVDYARMYPEVYAAIGIHPHSALELNIETYQGLMTLAGHKKVVAIGEIGLDYYYLKRSSQYSNYPSRERQITAFEQMLDMAMELGLPVIIHSREADTDLIAILKSYGGAIKGVIHCFCGNEEFAEEILKLGFMVSVTGNITYKNSDTLRQAIKSIPLKSLMLETDCPDLAPEPNRGKRNEPSFLIEIARKVAEIKGISLAEVEQATTKNALSLFGLNKS